MEGESVLLTIAQLGLTLVGFSALILAFRRAEKSWEGAEIIGQKIILELGLATTLLALLPLAVFHTIGSELVWAVSSGIYILFIVLWIRLIYQRVRRMGFANPRNSSNTAAQVMLLAVIVLQAVNMLFLRAFAPYLWGVLWLIFAAGLQFVLFVYGYMEEATGQNE